MTQNARKYQTHKLFGNQVMYWLYKSPAFMALACALTGCIGVGPAGIKNDRAFYREAIKQTNQEQLLDNIIAARFNEAPTFISVPEINATRSLSGGSSGGSSNINALLPLGQLTGMVSGSDSPVAKYVPLSGQELIQQLSNPISLSNVYRIYNSVPETTPLFVWSFVRLTPGYVDYNRAINIIYLLDLAGAITISSPDDRVLDLNFMRRGAVVRPSNEIAGDRPLRCRTNGITLADIDYLWQQLGEIYSAHGRNTIHLNSAGAIQPVKQLKGPMVFTRTGQGALQQADTQNVYVASPEEIAQIREDNKIYSCNNYEFYLAGRFKGRSIVQDWYDYFNASFDRNLSSASKADVLRRIGSDRALILIAKSTNRPSASFVETYRDGFWYYIESEDKISKKNFAILSTILTIQAPPTPVTATVTAISVGGAR